MLHKFDTPEPVQVYVKLGGGSVDITAEHRTTAAVEVTPFADSDSAREAADNTRVELRGDKLVVAAPESAGWMFRRSSKLRVEIKVPLNCPLNVKVASAQANCYGQYGNVSINSASGDVYVERVEGSAAINTASGDARLGDVSGEVRVNSASGDLTVGSIGGNLVAHSASGDIEIGSVQSDVRANTASGDIKVGTVRTGTVKLNTASGDVSIGVLAGAGVWLDLTTISGSTRSDLHIDEGAVAPHRDLTIQVRTASGNIALFRAAPTP